jgi:hypothetical protein
MTFNAIEKALDFVDGFAAVFGIVFDLALNMIMALQAFVAVEKIGHLFIHVGRIRVPVSHFNVAVAIEARRLGMHGLQKPVAVDAPSRRCITHAGCENQYQRNNPPNDANTHSMVFVNKPTHLNQSLCAPFLFYARLPFAPEKIFVKRFDWFMVIPFYQLHRPIRQRQPKTSTYQSTSSVQHSNYLL